MIIFVFQLKLKKNVLISVQKALVRGKLQVKQAC